MSVTSLALCASCGSADFQIVMTDITESIRCARCLAERMTTPAWIAAYGRCRASGAWDFEEIRAAMELSGGTPARMP